MTESPRQAAITEDAVEAAVERLIATHWDGTGCGTSGSNGCSRCYGPSPADALEVVNEVLTAILPYLSFDEAAVRADEGARWQRELFDECETAQWDPSKTNSFAEECAHLHEEVSEAFREWRLHKDFEIRYEPSGKPTGIPIEFADVLIGLFYNAELHGFDLLDAVAIKHSWNLKRSYPAEGRQLHAARGTSTTKEER